MDRRNFVRSAAMFTGASALGVSPQDQTAQQITDGAVTLLTVQTKTVARSLPHFWEECVGSDRAIVAMRAQWQEDLLRVKNEVGMKSVRFHGLFCDEMGVFPSGSKAPNFLYVDIVFDAMMERGIKPFVELSFMPSALASGPQTVFFYRGNISVPKEMKQWAELVRTFAEHLVDRYGIDQVSTWNFEVWNEPNLPFFWAGTQQQYFELYRASAVALKAVDPNLRVGGPSTARAAWVGDLLQFCANEKIPIDFASTHVYSDDPQKIVFGTDVQYPYEEVIPRALAKVNQEIRASKFPQLPLYITEWSSQNPAFIAHTIKSTIGLADIMSYWTFDNVFEELGIPTSFMNGAFGLLGMRGLPRPSFHTFELLHRLGDSELASSDGPILATRRRDGSLALLLWNLIPRPHGQRSATGDPTQQTADQFGTQGAGKPFRIRFDGARRGMKATATRVDSNSGSLARAYQTLGSPPYPTIQQIKNLRAASLLAQPEHLRLQADGELSLNIPPNGVVLIELA